MEENIKNLELSSEENAPAVYEPTDSSYQAELPAPDENKGMKKWISTKIGLINKEIDFNKAIPTANTSYLMSAYGKAYPSKERVDNFLKDLATAITTKNSKGEYACVKVLPDDLNEYKDAIIKLFKEKGYTAANLKDCINGVTSNYIFVCWDKFDNSKAV